MFIIIIIIIMLIIYSDSNASTIRELAHQSDESACEAESEHSLTSERIIIVIINSAVR